MRVILYIVITANGMIAGVDDTKDWSSKEDWAGFVAMAQKTGAIIIGKRTYDVARRTTGLLPGIKLRIVLTHKIHEKPKSAETIFMNASPQAILQFVASKGYKTVLVAGGSSVNSLFIKTGLINEIYLTVEPHILGRGIPLFSNNDFQTHLKLLGVKTLTNRQTVQLHYQVIK